MKDRDLMLMLAHLSIKAKGVFGIIRAYHEWDKKDGNTRMPVTIEMIRSDWPSGTATIRTALQELLDKGHVKHVMQREDGQYSGGGYLIIEHDEHGRPIKDDE